MRWLGRVAVGLCLLLAACSTELNSGLTQREANDMVALLVRAGIPAYRQTDAKDHTEAVFVESGRFADAVDLLDAHGLPRANHPTIADVFKGGGLVSSPVEERARMIYAMGEELSRSLSEIDGVLDARVHIVLPDNDPIRRDTTPASAAVFIRYAPDTQAAQLLPQIKQLVANGVQGLSYDKVSVVMVPAAVAPPMNEANAPVEVAGLWVSHDSAQPLQIVLGVGALLLLALAGLSGWFAWRIYGPAVKRSSLVVR